MTTAPSEANSFGNSSKMPASTPPTAPKTGRTGGNAQHRQTPTCHPDPSCCCMPSQSDSDGKPNTPQPNSPRTDDHPTKTVRQPAIKPPERR
jgi:hypothetical protein